MTTDFESLGIRDESYHPAKESIITKAVRGIGNAIVSTEQAIEKGLENTKIREETQHLRQKFSEFKKDTEASPDTAQEHRKVREQYKQHFAHDKRQKLYITTENEAEKMYGAGRISKKKYLHILKQINKAHELRLQLHQKMSMSPLHRGYSRRSGRSRRSM